VHGHVLDEDGRGVPNTLLEIWQANACGRYIHVRDQHPAPLDPNFTGAGRAQSDATGYYKFTTVKPGAYPWGNHTQCLAAGAYPLSVFRPCLHLAAGDADVFPERSAVSVRSDLQTAVTDAKARGAHVSLVRPENTKPEWALCLPLSNIVCCAGPTPRRWRNNSAGRLSTTPRTNGITPSQTVGPFFKYGLDAERPVSLERTPSPPSRHAGIPPASACGSRGGLFDGDGRRGCHQDCMLEVWAGRQPGPLSADPQGQAPGAAERGVPRLRPLAAPIADGAVRLRDTIMPGQVPDPRQAGRRRISCSRYSGAACCGISIRGSISAGEAANDTDPVLALVPADRRAKR